MITKDSNLLPCIEIEPRDPATHSVIWLHGLGADGNDFVPIIHELNLPDNSNVRFIFPHAPIMPVTVNNGYEMRAWYDIYGITLQAKIDREGIQRSVLEVEKLIGRELARGIPSQHIILAGFSQGAAIALTVGLCYKQTLGGIIALSGYLPLASELQQKANPLNQGIPIFLAHGTEDPIVPYALGLGTYDILQKTGYGVDWHSYPIPHSVCIEEIEDISKWMRRVIKQD